MEDDHEADDNDVPLHQVDDNDPSQTAMDSDMAGRDTQFNLLHQDTSELNSDQMHEDPGTAEDMAEDPLGIELREDQTESAPKEYLFTGGGFCMEEDDEEGTTVDQSVGEPVDRTTDACKDIGVRSESSDGGKSTEIQGASSSKRSNASRGLPKSTKRRRK
jgi:DNA excision repair protein ERCC-5